MPDASSVVFLTTDFRPMTGGIAEYLHGIAQSLSARAPVVVMTTAQRGGATWAHDYSLRELPPVVERRVGERAGDAVPPLRKLRTGLYFARLQREGTRAVGQLRRLSGDVRVVIGLWDVVSHFWCRACREARIPYALMAYGAELTAPLYGWLPAWRTADFRLADRVLACSSGTAALASDRLALGSMPAVVHPRVPAPPPSGDVARRRAELERDLGLGGRTLLLSIGRLVPRKGFDLVLRSVAALREHPTLTYVLAGDGPQRSELEHLARDLGVRDRVVMTGAIDELTKWALYDACDLFVMPNRTLAGTNWEGFGIVFLEVALAGRAAIGGCNGGVAEAIEHGRTGVLVDPERDGELTDAIRRLLDDEALRQRLGHEARQRAEQWASADAADRLCAVLSLNGAAA